MKHPYRKTVGFLTLLSAFAFVGMTSCSKSSLTRKVSEAQKEAPGGVVPTPKPTGVTGDLNAIAPSTAFDSDCENADGGAFGQSRRFSVRLYTAAGCPTGENEKSEIMCVPNYAFVLERHYFMKTGCAGARSAIVTRFFTLPEAVPTATSTSPSNSAITSSPINAKSGPVFFRVEGVDLVSLFQMTQFCAGPTWAIGTDIEVTGLTCGANAPFLDINTPIYSRWLRTENALQFGALALDAAARPTALDPALSFKIR